VTVAPAATPFRGTHLIYDPRQVAVLQALPVGVEILDTFCYEIIDMGAARVDGIPGGTISKHLDHSRQPSPSNRSVGGSFEAPSQPTTARSRSS
jgi:hypothetical protein